MRLSRGSMPPGLYGVAYHCFDADITICYPVPVHLIVRWARQFWFWIRFAGTRNRYDLALRAAFLDGRKQGRKEVFQSIWDTDPLKQNFARVSPGKVD